MRAILFLACMLSAVAAFPQNAQDSVAKKAKGKVDNEKAVSVSELFAVGEKTFGGNKSSVKGHYFKGHWKGYYVALWHAAGSRIKFCNRNRVRIVRIRNDKNF